MIDPCIVNDSEAQRRGQRIAVALEVLIGLDQAHSHGSDGTHGPALPADVHMSAGTAELFQHVHNAQA